MSRPYYACAYYLSWGFFALGGLLLNLCCVPLLLVPPSEARAVFVRRRIQGLFTLWLWWLRTSGVVQVRWTGFEGKLDPGLVYVANHPTLVDATFLMARLPNAVCVFKPALLHNPTIGLAARLAGYLVNDESVGVLRQASEAVAGGKSLLVFPEGTRTAPDQLLEPIRPGFALISLRGRAPIQLIVIRVSDALASRGHAWWKLPARLPVYVDLVMDRRWQPNPELNTHRLAAQVEARLRDVLGNPQESESGPCDFRSI